MPKVTQFNFAEDIVLNQYSTQRDLLTFNLLPNDGRQFCSVESNDSVLYHSLRVLGYQRDFSGVPLSALVICMDLHIDGFPRVSLDRHRHVGVMIKEFAVGLRNRCLLDEIAEFGMADRFSIELINQLEEVHEGF